MDKSIGTHHDSHIGSRTLFFLLLFTGQPYWNQCSQSDITSVNFIKWSVNVLFLIWRLSVGVKQFYLMMLKYAVSFLPPKNNSFTLATWVSKHTQRLSGFILGCIFNLMLFNKLETLICLPGFLHQQGSNVGTFLPLFLANILEVSMSRLW